jgi:hypothetical protein
MRLFSVEQRSDAWFSARRGLPTCSRFDSILTPRTAAPASAQETLLNELIAESILPPELGLIKPQFTNDDIERGMILEAEARCAYDLEFAKGQPVTEAGFVLHDSGLFGGSPDALVGEDGGVEIKCPAPATHIGYIRKGVLPDAYKCQVHGYLLVSGRKFWSFFSYARAFPPFHIRVERDDFTAKLEAELFNFCSRYNQERAKFGLAPIGNAASAA